MMITTDDESDTTSLVTVDGTSRRLAGAVPETVLTTALEDSKSALTSTLPPLEESKVTVHVGAEEQSVVAASALHTVHETNW